MKLRPPRRYVDLMIGIVLLALSATALATQAGSHRMPARKNDSDSARP